MNIFRWATKKIFVILAFIIGFSFSLTSYAQSFTIEVASLVRKNNEWYQANTPNFLKKTPFDVKDISSAQLADSNIPNATEINEINKSIEQRLRFTNAYGQIALKYIKPLDAAQALANMIKNAVAQQTAYVLRLRDGKINFGQYNQYKQELYAENKVKYNEIIQKYDLKAQLSASTPTQQVPSQQAPRQNPPAQPAQSQNLINRTNKVTIIGSCHGTLLAYLGSINPHDSFADKVWDRYKSMYETMDVSLWAQAEIASSLAAQTARQDGAQQAATQAVNECARLLK